MQDFGLSEADNGKLINIEMDQQVLLSLPENPSTGYTWSIEETEGIQVQSSTFLLHPAQMIGTAGQHLWMIRLLSLGDLPIHVKLWREWEGDQSVQRRFEVTLRVLRRER
jgi:inhibitor of cysteine peptidase